MWKEAIDQRSPMRNIENSIHKGLGPGLLGAITARPGVGKTACLMQFGINELIHERGVLHVAVNQTASRVRDVYDELLREMVHACGIDNAFDAVRAAVERNRHIHGYTADAFEVGHISHAMAFLRQYADFLPRIVLIDGLDLVAHGPEVIAELKALAEEREVAIWMTLLSDDDQNATGLPAKLKVQSDLFTQVVHLAAEGNHVSLQVIKNGESAKEELRVHLDNTTMLLYKGA